MKHLAKPAAALVVIAALIAVGSLMPQPGNAANGMTPQPVLVTNGAAQPVPIAGTVSGSVGASQAGSWSVGINNTPTVNVASMPPLSGTVNIANTPLPTSNTDDARQPFQRQFFLSIPDGSFAAQDTSIVIPTGKRLVIEQISAYMSVPVGQLPTASVGSRALGNFAVVRALSVKYGTLATNPPSDQWLAVNPVLLFADPGETLLITFQRQTGDGFANGQITISGHFVDML